MTKSVSTRITMLLVVIGVLTAAAVAVVVPRLIGNLIREEAGRSADQTVRIVKALRGYYTENVVAPANKSGVLRTHYLHKGDDAVIPLPATMVHEWSDKLAQEGISLDLYSIYPFPHRASRQLDSFKQQAWDEVSKRPQVSYARTQTENGRQLMRVAIADTLQSPACVNCHNNHPDTPRVGWALGDVRGVLEVRLDLTENMAAAREVGWILAGILVVITLAGSAALFASMRRSLLAPIASLSNVAQSFAQGDMAVAIDGINRPDEIGALARSLDTFRKQTEEIQEAEQRLQQAQRMEAVGQLTGGVAHDFNNLLAVMMGNAELLKPESDEDKSKLKAILRAASRGSELTQRLLAFSRQQPLRPQAIDLAALAGGMTDLLARTLGATIEIETHTASGLWLASADPGQVENALLNLAINARDAMPGGGKLTIECTNARLDEAYVADNPYAITGDYAVIAVSDNGTGMSEEVQARAFEPFFTTKEVGQGSGLGLSMVYGFAKQSDGHVNIYSEDGKGTTVKIYLPRATGIATSDTRNVDESLPMGHGEKILVVEDDDDVRVLASLMLEGLGYRVVAVPEAASARAALEAEDDLSLVLSDVILPGGESGPEFAEELRTTNPDLKIIFMSGYPATAAKRNGAIGADRVLLNKPFQRRQLAEAVHQQLYS